MQYQISVKKDSQIVDQIDSLDLYVSLKSRLDDPFTLFIRLKDVETDSDTIYFYAYSLGKMKIVLWGIYNKIENAFYIDSGCKYNPNDLKLILDKWKENNYKFLSTASKNSYSSRIRQNILFENVKKEIDYANMFRKYFIANLIRKGLISNKILDDDVNNLVSDTDFNTKYGELLKTISQESRKILEREEEGKVESRGEKMMKLIFDNIDNDQDEQLLRNALRGSGESNNAYINYLLIYSLVNVFIFELLDMRDYRTAKYINYIFNHEKDSRRSELNKYILNEFIYYWITEIGKILRVIDLKRFINEYSQLIIDTVEEKLNTTGGLIGGDNSLLDNRYLEKLSVFFETFISKSQYSKISIANQMKACPSLKDCDREILENELCDLYNFKQSKFDYK